MRPLPQKMGISTPVPPDRTNEHTQQYAAAVVELGKQAGVPVVDLFNSLQDVPGWQNELLSDGLHFTPAGSRRVWQGVREALESHMPLLRCVVAGLLVHRPVTCKGAVARRCCCVLLCPVPGPRRSTTTCPGTTSLQTLRATGGSGATNRPGATPSDEGRGPDDEGRGPAL
jgi:hypothetical protein